MCESFWSAFFLQREVACFLKILTHGETSDFRQKFKCQDCIFSKLWPTRSVRKQHINTRTIDTGQIYFYSFDIIAPVFAELLWGHTSSLYTNKKGIYFPYESIRFFSFSFISTSEDFVSSECLIKSMHNAPPPLRIMSMICSHNYAEALHKFGLFKV